MYHSPQQPRQDGSVVVSVIYIMMFLTTISLGVLLLANANLQRAYSRIFVLQAQYAAESGADAAIAELNAGVSFTGTASDVTVLNNTGYKATYATTVSAGLSGKQEIITAVGKVYRPAAATTATYTRTIRVTAERTSTTTASGIMSRNIIDVDSSVKSISGTDIYLNGYINLRSNTTALYFEKLIVAGRDTGSSNCSIEGKGILNKSTLLPSGTPATITTAFNNCISPPGNTSNSNFTVSANNSSVTPIQSMYVPWSQYMDATYSNSPGGCNDWIGSGTLTIPSTGNTKKTHYPDSGSGVSTSCGTKGDLSLGSNTYNITDNVHIRANLCRTTACSPTFNNTSGSIKYVFIEGTINFSSVQTCSPAIDPTTPSCNGTTSAPIVFITYGADPGLQTKCTYGDSLFLGNTGSGGISAPAAYFLATNGLCIYQSKFGSSPALGGIGGKNIYIASNSGTPYTLALDPNFPLNEIPVDLAWRAVGYERL